MTKSGKQDVLMNLGDIYPTIVDIVGAKTPKNYKIDGESMIPFLTTSKKGASRLDLLISFKYAR